MAAVARISAVLVAGALSGAPRVLAMHAPLEGHRCECKAQRGGNHHECECMICRRAALSAQATDEKVPPCHRAAARKALSERAPAGPRSEPCIEGTCGRAGEPTTTAAGVEPFCLPVAAAVALVDRTEPRQIVADAARDRALEPETPPPRAA